MSLEELTLAAIFGSRREPRFRLGTNRSAIRGCALLPVGEGQGQFFTGHDRGRAATHAAALALRLP